MVCAYDDTYYDTLNDNNFIWSMFHNKSYSYT